MSASHDGQRRRDSWRLETLAECDPEFAALIAEARRLGMLLDLEDGVVCACPCDANHHFSQAVAAGSSHRLNRLLDP